MPLPAPAFLISTAGPSLRTTLIIQRLTNYIWVGKKTNEPGSFTLFSLQLLLTFTAVNAFSSKYAGFLALTAHTLRSGYRRHIR